MVVFTVQGTPAGRRCKSGFAGIGCLAAATMAAALLLAAPAPARAQDPLTQFLDEIFNQKNSRKQSEIWPKDYQNPKFRRQIQEYLDALGFNVGEIDGKFGSATLAAIAAWQVRQGYKGDRKLTPAQTQTLRRMAAAAPKRMPVTPVSRYAIIADNLGISPVRELIVRCLGGGEIALTQHSDHQWRSPYGDFGDFHELALKSCS